MLCNCMSKDVFWFTFSVKKGMEKVQVKMGRSSELLAACPLQNQLPPWWHSVRALAGASWCLQTLFVIADALWREAKILCAKTKMSASSSNFRRFHL